MVSVLKTDKYALCTRLELEGDTLESLRQEITELKKEKMVLKAVNEILTESNIFYFSPLNWSGKKIDDDAEYVEVFPMCEKVLIGGKKARECAAAVIDEMKNYKTVMKLKQED